MTAPLPRVVLACDEDGDWTLSEPGAPARQFPDFDAALRCARLTPHIQSATIEVWERGQYVCCLPSDSWPHCRATSKAAPMRAEDHARTGAEQAANRVGRFLLSTVGPAFWIAVVVALVMSLGWRIVLL